MNRLSMLVVATALLLPAGATLYSGSAISLAAGT